MWQWRRYVGGGWCPRVALWCGMGCGGLVGMEVGCVGVVPVHGSLGWRGMRRMVGGVVGVVSRGFLEC